jgi:hypothetical protein
MSADRSTISVVAMLGESMAKSLPARNSRDPAVRGQGPHSNSAAQLGVRPPELV